MLEQIGDSDDTDGPYVVRVSIRDDMTGDNGFHRQSTTLTYAVNGDPEEEIPLIHMRHDLFRAEIPGQDLGSVVTYQAHATDWAGNEGSSDPLVFVVGAFFIRGDTNGDSVIVGIVDAIRLICWGFLDCEEPVCMDAADADDNGEVGVLLDTLYILLYAYSGGSPPPAPGPSDCGRDPTDDDLNCGTVSDACL